MQPSVLIFSLLTAFASASPAQHEARALGGMGGVSGYSSTSAHRQSSTVAQNGFSAGPGGVGAVSSYRHQSSSSYSSSTVLNTFSGLGNQISGFQGLLAGGGLTRQVAYSRMQRLASSFQMALSQTPMCGGCFGTGGFVGGVSSVFKQFHSLLISLRTRFGEGFYPQLLSPFSGLQTSFQSFFHSASSYGVSYSSFVPSGLPSLLSPAIPHFSKFVGFK